VANKQRTIFLGLRTNVRYFASRKGFAALDTRLKALALLYDNLLFENGVYDSSVGEAGSFDVVTPLVSDDLLKPRRTRRGAPMGVRIQNEQTGDWATAFATRSVQSFRAQFISTLKQLTALKADWARYISFSSGIPGYEADLQVASDLARDWTWDERDLVKQTLPNMPSFLRDKIHSNLNIDLARASIMGCELSPDAIHEPLLVAKTAASPLEEHTTGERALRLVFPELASARWEDVAELRRESGLTSLRDMLREVDTPELADRAVMERIHHEYLKELDRRRPRWWQPAVAGALTAIGFIPFIGQAAATVGGVIDTASGARDAWQGSRHWSAALIKARRRLRR
jgi:hypothetical protein